MSDSSGYIRFEASGIWRENAETPPRDVIVSLGERTLVLSDLGDRILGHWARAGLTPLRTEGETTVYTLSAESGETLAIGDRQMNVEISGRTHDAQVSPRKRRKRPRLGLILAASFSIGLSATLASFAPGAMRHQTLRLIQPGQAAELSDRILLILMDKGAQPCRHPTGERNVNRLTATLAAPGETPVRTRVMDLADASAARLPDGSVIVSQSAVAAARVPEDLAAVLAVALARDPLETLVNSMGPVDHMVYFLTADLRPTTLDDAARAALAPATSDEMAAAATRLEALGLSTGAEGEERSGDDKVRLLSGTSASALEAINWASIKRICRAAGIR